MRRQIVLFTIILCLFGIAAASLTSCSRLAFHPDLERELIELASLDAKEMPRYLQALDREDSIGAFYKDERTRAATLEFFASVTGSEPVAKFILDNAERYEVPASLAFALAYEESKFTVSAVNKNADSIDRGLFQLNSKSFPKLSVQEFYDPETNAKYGLSHLQHCLRSGGNEVAALAMYNAGNGRVDRGATPRRTLDYVYRILKYQENIDSLFAAKVAAAPRRAWPRLPLADASLGAGAGAAR
ncbi:MAG TPA: transglycosylase SLT domain-containing protein [Spirochaetales bacterium]|nr:transglycosylase SLT domain-containing protein [Spirochaetales bacterium]